MSHLTFIAGHAGKSARGFSPDALEAMRGYHWPGNLRELRNVIERAVLLCQPGGTVGLEHLPQNLLNSPSPYAVGDLVALETIDEIGYESREVFRHAGGETLHRCPCLNDHPAWIRALQTLILEEGKGWLS